LAVNVANDFGDLVRNKLYRVSSTGELIGESAQLDSGLQRALRPDWISRSGWARLLRAAGRGLALRLQAWRLGADIVEPDPRPVAEVLLRERFGEFHNRFVQRDPVVRNLLGDSWDAEMSLLPGSEVAASKRALMAALLSEFERIALGEGVPLLVLVIPSPIDVTPDHYGLVVDWERFPDYDGDAPSRSVVDAAVALGLPVVDLTQPMREHESPRSLFFRAGNDHWNASGQELAARLTADRIRALGWLDAGHESASPSIPAPANRGE
jgi:hypothetical protein